MSETSTERIIEIRRHAERHRPGDNLNRAGVARARRASTCDRTFARVVTSQLPRAVQTAVAMGHAVDEEDWTLASMGLLVGEVIPWDAGFAAIAQAIRTHPAAAAFAEIQALQLRHHLDRAGGDLLVVSHGGVAEAGIIGLLDSADVSGFGASLDYCEGARLTLVGDRCARIRVLRFRGDMEVECAALPLESDGF